MDSEESEFIRFKFWTLLHTSMVNVTLVQFSGSSWYALYIDNELVEEEQLGDLRFDTIFEELAGETVNSYTHEFSTAELSNYGGFAPDKYEELPEPEDIVAEY